jgi:hypothetical protein
MDVGHMTRSHDLGGGARRTIDTIVTFVGFVQVRQQGSRNRPQWPGPTSRRGPFMSE